MSNGLPAARKTDSVTHRSGNIITGSSRVRISGLPAARVGDVVQHGYGIEVITEGSSAVRISGQFAARVTDAVACGGRIASGSSRVSIGRAIGQAAPSGQAQGNPSNKALVGQKMCQDAARGRNLNTPNRRSRNLTAAMQSYSNCGIESARQIINKVTGKNLTEDGLMRIALDSNLALRGAPTEVPVRTPPRYEDGGTVPIGIQALLREFNITSTVQPNNLNNISKALASGKGVIASVDSKVLWTGKIDPVKSTPNPDHDILVTGLEYDDNGKITDVIINDTGAGECSRKVPVDIWNKASRSTPDHPSLLNVTDKPIF